MESKPIFIGSSSAGLEVAKVIQQLLKADGYATVIWNQGMFGLGKSILEELVAILHRCAFGIFVFRADDELTSKGTNYPATRDNVLFELGLFIGRLGRSKVFIVYDISTESKIMADLGGVIFASFDGSGPDLNLALAPAISQIQQQIGAEKKPEKIFYTEWHLGNKQYIERLLLSKNEWDQIIGYRTYQEVGGKLQTFEVHGFQGEGLYWLEYHRPDERGGGTIMLRALGSGNFDGLITAGHCDTSALRCYKNRWTQVSDEKEAIVYRKEWLIEIGIYK